MKTTGSKSFNMMRVFVPAIFGILVMVSLYQILPSERGKITKIVETTTSTFFESTEDESIEGVSESKEKSTTTTTTTTIEETTTTSTTILPGDSFCEELGCPYGTNFVGSKNSDLYHYCHCSFAKRIKPENLVCFFGEEEAIEKGYTQSSCQQTTTTTSTKTTTTTTSSTTSSTTTTETTTTSTTVTTTSTTSTIEESTTTTTTSSTTTTINECTSLGCPEGTQFVGSKNSDKYHYCHCTWAKKIKPDNLKCFQSKEEAQAEGYVPCGTCKPPE